MLQTVLLLLVWVVVGEGRDAALVILLLTMIMNGLFPDQVPLCRQHHQTLDDLKRFVRGMVVAVVLVMGMMFAGFPLVFLQAAILTLG